MSEIMLYNVINETAITMEDGEKVGVEIIKVVLATKSKIRINFRDVKYVAAPFIMSMVRFIVNEGGLDIEWINENIKITYAKKFTKELYSHCLERSSEYFDPEKQKIIEDVLLGDDLIDRMVHECEIEEDMDKNKSLGVIDEKKFRDHKSIFWYKFLRDLITLEEEDLVEINIITKENTIISGNLNYVKDNGFLRGFDGDNHFIMHTDDISRITLEGQLMDDYDNKFKYW